MRPAGIGGALLATPLMLVLSAAPAVAGSPSNDTVAGATPVMPGFGEELDTSEATTDADDAQLNATWCDVPATDASVWYALTSDSVTPVVVDVSQSSYSAGVLIGIGTPGNLETISCGRDTAGFFVNSGYTYYVLAVDTQLDGGGNGGTLRISFNEASPPTVDITVDPVGRFDPHTGIATLTGTYSCTNSDFIEVLGAARQNVGRFTVVGFFEFEDFGTCDGTPRSWLADVFPVNGDFAGGKAMTVTLALTCGPVECLEALTEQSIQLTGEPSR